MEFTIYSIAKRLHINQNHSIHRLESLNTKNNKFIYLLNIYIEIVNV